MKPGDVLLYEGHHTAINLTHGEKVKHDINILAYRWQYFYNGDLRLVQKLIQKHYEICYKDFCTYTDRSDISPDKQIHFPVPVYLIEYREDGIRNVYMYRKI